MNLLMITNNYLPLVTGVSRSVEAFTLAYRQRGHRVMVVTPEFEGQPESEEDIIRVPAIQHFNGSDFSVRLPIPGLVAAALKEFSPEVIHSHHPFLLGDTALLLSASENAPLVFTHHTMYEEYTHYVPGDSPTMQRFVKELSTGYANLCDLVFAPSESTAAILKERGVGSPIEVLPTGVQVDDFVEGDGAGFRQSLNIPANAFVVGHLGRLAPEKNLHFLMKAVAEYLKKNDAAHFLLAGAGPSLADIESYFSECGLASRLHIAGVLTGKKLTDAYHAMDVFAFASKSETQGMVLTEALSAGVPVVAIDAPGAREVVKDTEDGRLLSTESIDTFSEALSWVASQPKDKASSMKKVLRKTVEDFSMNRTAERALALYESLLEKAPGQRNAEDSMWSTALRMIETEWEIWANRAHAAGAALHSPSSKFEPQ